MNKNKESKYEIIKKGKLLLKKIEQIDEIADIINAQRLSMRRVIGKWQKENE